MQNVVGPTPVAMATKFGLGAEIPSPTGLLVLVFMHENKKFIRMFVPDSNNVAHVTGPKFNGGDRAMPCSDSSTYCLMDGCVLFQQHH